MTQAAAEIAAESRRMRGRKPKAPQILRFRMRASAGMRIFPDQARSVTGYARPTRQSQLDQITRKGRRVR